MCDRRELDRLREQRDDAIERAVNAAELLIEVATERDALAEILADVTTELAEMSGYVDGSFAEANEKYRRARVAEARIEAVLALLCDCGFFDVCGHESADEKIRTALAGGPSC